MRSHGAGTSGAERFADRARRRLPRRVAIRRLHDLLRDSSCRVVAIDYFGTVVTRSVPPWYVKLLAGRRLTARLGIEIEPAELYRARIELERGLCRQALDRGHDANFRLDDLALQFREFLTNATGRSRCPLPDPEDFTVLMIDAEVQTELLVQQVDNELVRVLREQANSELVVVSDFYVPQPHFGRFLDHHRFTDLIDEVFVSCDHGRTKKSGALFELVSDRLGVEPSDMLVLGDDPVSDGQRARAVGMHTCLVPRAKWERRKHAPAEEVTKDVERRLDEVLRPTDDRDLYPAMALTLYAFVRRLHSWLRENGATEAFFLAREGQFLSRLFTAYEEEEGLRGAITPRYLMTSRRATDPVEQRSSLVAYLDEALGLAGHRTVYLVDVGWKGTTQDQLARVLAPRHALTLIGCYLGLLAPTPPDPPDSKVGILFHNQPERSACLEVFTQFKAMFEVLLAADHGSVLGYERRADRVLPILADDAAERDEYERHIAPVQAHIERRFRLVCRELARSVVDDDELVYLAARHHARMVFAPSSAEIRFFQQLPVYNAGHRLESGKRRAPDGRRRPTLAHLMTPRQLVSGGGWPPLRMRAAGLGWLRHPYGWYKLGVQRRRARRARSRLAT